MNHLDLDYQTLLQDILSNGTRKQTRNGEVLSIFGRQIRHDMKDGFPLLTTKKMYFKGIVTELIWFLRGDTNIKFLVDNDVHIWTGDAYKKYTDHFIGYEDVPNQDWFVEQIKTDIEFANRWGDLGPIYGKQWRKWKTFRKVTTNTPSKPTDSVDYIDQIANLINELKTNPDSRRLMVSAWNVGELDSMVLPPCHYGFQVYTRELSLEERVEIYGVEKIQTNNAGWYECSLAELDVNQANIPKRAISLMWNQRSVDTFLGLPFNIASYGLLLEIIAKEVNMVPDELIGNLGDTHLYLNHIEQAKEQIGREPYTLPRLMLPNIEGQGIFDYTPTDIEIWDYRSYPTIKAPLSN